MDSLSVPFSLKLIVCASILIPLLGLPLLPRTVPFATCIWPVIVSPAVLTGVYPNESITAPVCICVPAIALAAISPSTTGLYETVLPEISKVLASLSPDTAPLPNLSV